MGKIDDLHVAAVTAIVEHGIYADVQELLTHGNPSRGIPPGAMKRAVRAVLQALLPPDEGMIRAAQMACQSLPYDHGLGDEDASLAIAATINHILNEGD